MAKHTPGPWEANYRDRMYVTKCDPKTAADEHAIALVYRRRGMDFEDLLSTARLLAAAPDLLAACERFVAAMRRGDKIEMLDLIESLHEADAAIHAATGETE